MTILRQVEAFDVLHGQDEALAEPAGGIGRDNVGVMQPGRIADLGEEAVHHVGVVDEVGTDDLEDLLPAHEAVAGEVDDAHAAVAELAEDFIVGVVGQPRGERADRRG